MLGTTVNFRRVARAPRDKRRELTVSQSHHLPFLPCIVGLPTEGAAGSPPGGVLFLPARRSCAPPLSGQGQLRGGCPALSSLLCLPFSLSVTCLLQLLLGQPLQPNRRNSSVINPPSLPAPPPGWSDS